MKDKMIMYVVSMMLERMTTEDMEKWADMGLDMLEDAIEKSENKWDDKVALPMIKLMRDAFGIEDND